MRTRPSGWEGSPAVAPCRPSPQPSNYIRQSAEMAEVTKLILNDCSLPVALAPFTNAFYREDVRAEQSIETHIRRVLTTPFGESG